MHILIDLNPFHQYPLVSDVCDYRTAFIINTFVLWSSVASFAHLCIGKQEIEEKTHSYSKLLTALSILGER